MFNPRVLYVQIGLLPRVALVGCGLYGPHAVNQRFKQTIHADLAILC